MSLSYNGVRVHGTRPSWARHPGEEPVVIALVDHTASSTTPRPQSELMNVAKTAGATDENRVRALLRLLSVDHYVTRDVDGRYRFRYNLLRRGWLLELGPEES